MTDNLLKDVMQQDKTLSPWFYDADASRAAALLMWNDNIAYAQLSYIDRVHKKNQQETVPAYMQGISATFHNQQGRVLLSMAMPEMSSFVLKEELLSARRRVLLTLCAVRLYMWEHEGKIPQKAEELVPQYLSKVPKDPFDVGSITLADGFVSSAFHFDSENQDHYKNRDDGPYLYRSIATPNAAKEYIPPSQRKGKRRR